jgi:DNA-binding SARP family transcriptional activator
MEGRAAVPGTGSPAHVSYSILGPLAIRFSDRAVTPGALKVRVILAVLLVRMNSTVSIDTLLHEVWGERLPRTALQALRVYVSQLRQLLRSCPHASATPVLTTQAQGYRLEADPELLDSVRFERLCRQGHLAHGRGDPEGARSAYRAALDLRQADALSDVRSAGPLLQGAALRLDEMWMTTLLSRIDADLRLGAHDQVVAELRELCVFHPLHEGLHARLMIALSTVGRTKDALEVYATVRAALVADLGVEPNSMVRSVHQAILNSDCDALRRATLT